MSQFSQNGFPVISAEGLIALHIERHGFNKTVQNQVSAFRTLVTRLGVPMASDCSWMRMQRGFEKTVASVRQQQSSDDGTYRAYLSNINRVRLTYQLEIAKHTPQKNIWESYLFAWGAYSQRHPAADQSAQRPMRKTDFILRCFNATGMQRKRLYAPKIRATEPTWNRIKALEEELEAPGTLTKWLVKTFDHAKQYQTAFGKRASQAHNPENRYGLRFDDWPAALKEEWEALFLLKTAPTLAKARWGIRIPVDKMYTWRTRNFGRNPSAQCKKTQLEQFFGWCLLQRHLIEGTDVVDSWRSGPGLKREELSFSLFTDAALVADYLAFRKIRAVNDDRNNTDGIYNHSCSLVLELASMLLHRETGFITLRRDWYFQPDKPSSPRNVAKRVPTEFEDDVTGQLVHEAEPHKRWRTFCAGLRNDYRAMRKHGDKEKKQTRNPSDPVAEILNLENPLQVYGELREKLRMEPVEERWIAHHARKRLFFEIITRNPLRELHFAIMTTNNLVRLAPCNKGLAPYRLKFPKGDFKNARFLKEAEFTYDLPKEITPLIDEFLQVHWPALHGRAITPQDRIFLPATPSDGLTEEVLTERTQALIYKICRETTARHLSEDYHTPGFGPHTFRHITATGIIKATGNHQKAADLLWDDITTILDTYGHIKRSESLAKAGAELEQFSKQSHNQSGNGNPNQSRNILPLRTAALAA